MAGKPDTKKRQLLAGAKRCNTCTGCGWFVARTRRYKSWCERLGETVKSSSAKKPRRPAKCEGGPQPERNGAPGIHRPNKGRVRWCLGNGDQETCNIGQRHCIHLDGSRTYKGPIVCTWFGTRLRVVAGNIQRPKECRDRLEPVPETRED